MVSKTVACPQCKTHVKVTGEPGQSIILICPHCHLKGSFSFPKVPESQMYSIQINGLQKIYKEVRAVDDVSFSVLKGEIFGFLGPNGAGKSTTIKAIIGLIHPTTGSIAINGFDLLSNPVQAKEKIGYLPERVSFFDNLTALQTLHFFCELRNIDPSIAPQILKDVGLKDAMGRKVGTFSKGMTQLLGIAQTLIGEPTLYILDEPMSGLDARWVKIIRERIKTLNAKGATILFSSHNLSEVESICDRVGIINKGKLIAIDTVSNLNMHLKQKPRLEITISHLNGKIPEILRTFEGIDNINVTNDTLTMTCDKKHRSKIIFLLEQKGFPISNIKTMEPSLEDAFVKLIEGGT
jgi:ABC-type multidrug transport system ATPase subunit